MARSNKLLSLTCLGLLTLPLIHGGCAGRVLEGQIGGLQERIYHEQTGLIVKGAKTHMCVNGQLATCAPREIAIAEAQIKFAEEALRMGEYYRGKEHVQLAGKYTEIAELKTDPVLCHPDVGVTKGAEPTPGDRDGDGYDDDKDGCPDEPEDFDAFEDEDGCADKDNDGDGVEDASTLENGIWINLDKKDDLDCRNEPEDPDGFEDEDGCPDPDNDQDGILDGDDACPNDAEDFDQFEDEDGCPEPDNDKDGILDKDDSCPLDPEDFDGDQDEDGCPDLAVKVDPCAIKLDDKVYFEFDKSKVDPKSFKLLDDVVTVMNANPDITIEIGGHTDSKGSGKYNRKLSQERVNNVREYIVNKGIAGNRITAVGYGEDVPIDTNRTAEGRANNRRVEFNRTDNPDCKK